MFPFPPPFFLVERGFFFLTRRILLALFPLTRLLVRSRSPFILLYVIEPLQKPVQFSRNLGDLSQRIFPISVWIFPPVRTPELGPSLDDPIPRHKLCLWCSYPDQLKLFSPLLPGSLEAPDFIPLEAHFLIILNEIPRKADIPQGSLSLPPLLSRFFPHERSTPLSYFFSRSTQRSPSYCMRALSS